MKLKVKIKDEMKAWQKEQLSKLLNDPDIEKMVQKVKKDVHLNSHHWTEGWREFSEGPGMEIRVHFHHKILPTQVINATVIIPMERGKFPIVDFGADGLTDRVSFRYSDIDIIEYLTNIWYKRKELDKQKEELNKIRTLVSKAEDALDNAINILWDHKKAMDDKLKESKK